MAGKINKRVKRRHAPYSKFKCWMDEHDVGQKELAELLNKSISCVNQNLNGTGGDFSMRDMRKICKRYGISSDTYFVEQNIS